MPSPLDRAQAGALLGRGVFLHASGVCVEGTGLVFLAPSRGGKSTTAVRLLSRGHRPVGDDTLIVCRDSSGEVMIHPSPSFLARLGWRPESCPLGCFVFIERGQSGCLSRLDPEYAYYRAVRDSQLMSLEYLAQGERRQALCDLWNLITEYPSFLLRSSLSSNLEAAVERIIDEI